MTPDLAKLKALAEAAGIGNRMAVDVSTILALLSHITRVEAERDAAFKAGLEASADYLLDDDLDGLSLEDMANDIRALTRGEK